MPTHSEIRQSPYTPKQLFDLVADIEHYPEFLPWCRAARINERHPEYFIGELIISFSHLTERYTSKVMLVHPTSTSSSGLYRGSMTGVDPRYKPEDDAKREGNGEGTIEVALVNGPFNHLYNHWRFVPKADGGTEIHFAVEFQFKSKLLDTLIGGLFGRAVEKMGAAFMARADILYGNK